MLLLNTFAALLLSISSPVLAADTNAWKSRSIYFALTDRLARSSTDTGGPACSDLSNYCGGTFQGLEGKLDYIQGLGFDSIWITPIVKNGPGGYHGYYAIDLYSINSNYGTADDLKSLVNAAHSRGMYVMCDVVANHVAAGDVSTYNPSLLAQNSSYHPACDIDYNNQTSIEWCRVGNTLPDVYTTKPEIRSMYQTWIKWLVTEYNFDGLRVDTVKHVEKDFWTPFVSAAGVYAIGEVLNGDPAYVNNYTKVMPGLLNYPMYYPVKEFFLQQGSSQSLVNTMDTIKNTFPDPTTLGNFIDNHDNERFLSDNSDTALLKNALAWVVLARGIPILYYGTEQAFNGGNDPANREDLWRSYYNTNSDMYQAIKKLTGARKGAGGLPGNDHTHLYVNATAYAWSRVNGSLVVLTTNGGSNYNTQHCFNTQVPNGQWNDVFNGGTAVKADGTGHVCVNVSKGQPIVLVSSSTSTPAPSVAPSSAVASVAPSSVPASSATGSAALASSSVVQKPAASSQATPTSSKTVGGYGYGYENGPRPRPSATTLHRATKSGYYAMRG